MSDPHPEPVERDSRGILDPRLLQQRVSLTRYPVMSSLAGLIDRFWAVEWDLPDGTLHSQQVLTHPSASLSVGHADARVIEGPVGRLEGRLNGVARSLTTRVLVGQGWVVAAMTTPGGLGAFISQPASVFTDRVVPIGAALGVDEERLVEEIGTQAGQASRVDVLAAALEGLVAVAEP